MFSAAFRATKDPHVETLRTVLLRMDLEDYASSIAVLRDTDLSSDLALVRAPTLIVTAKRDSLLPTTAVEAFKRGVRQSTHLEIDPGHSPS